MTTARTIKYGDEEVPVIERFWKPAERLPYRKTYSLKPGQYWKEAAVTSAQWEHYVLLDGGEAVPVGAVIARELLADGLHLPCLQNSGAASFLLALTWFASKRKDRFGEYSTYSELRLAVSWAGCQTSSPCSLMGVLLCEKRRMLRPRIDSGQSNMLLQALRRNYLVTNSTSRSLNGDVPLQLKSPNSEKFKVNGKLSSSS